MKVPWEAVTAMTAVIALLGALFVYYVRRVVRDEIEQLLVRLNGTYVRAPECAAYRAAEISALHEQSRRIGRIEDSIST